MRSHGAHPPSLAWKALATRWQRGLIGLAIFLLLAQLLGSSGLLSRSVLPLASTVLARAAGLAASPRFLTDLAATLEAWAAGLATAVAVAVPCGLILGSVPGVRSATRALVEFLRPIPAVVLIPLAALLLGPGLRMNVTLIAYAAAWPVLLNTVYGLDDVDPLAKETLRAFGFGRIAVIRRVCSLPSAAPFIVTGIRLASSWRSWSASASASSPAASTAMDRRLHRRREHQRAQHRGRPGGGAVWAGVLGLALNALIAWPGGGRCPGFTVIPGSQDEPHRRTLAGAGGRVCRVAGVGDVAPQPVLSPPSAIVARMYDLWFSRARHPPAAGDTERHQQYPAQPGPACGGLAIAIAVAMPLGIALGAQQRHRPYLEPLLHFGRSMWLVAFVTVFTIVFSLGTQSEIAFIAFGTTWPILLNTIDGARSVDALQTETAQAFRLPLGSRITS
jgi:NitT/TauT family transport system permease protein